MLLSIRRTIKKAMAALFCGEVTTRKKSLWLLCVTCILAGIVLGLVNAPLTHGITVSCGNGNGNNNYYGREPEELEGDEE